MTDTAPLTPPAKLTPFEGEPTLAAGITIPGLAGGLRDAMKIDPQEFHADQRLYIVVEADVEKFGYEPIRSGDQRVGWRRVHILTANAATFVDGDLVAAAVKEHKARLVELQEAEKGQGALTDPRDEGVKGEAVPPDPYRSDLEDGEGPEPDPADLEDDETPVMVRQHLTGAHDEGEPREACPLCQGQSMRVGGVEPSPAAAAVVDRLAGDELPPEGATPESDDEPVDAELVEPTEPGAGDLEVDPASPVPGHVDELEGEPGAATNADTGVVTGPGEPLPPIPDGDEPNRARAQAAKNAGKRARASKKAAKQR